MADLNSDLALLCFFANSPNTCVLEFVEHKIGNSKQPRTSFYDDYTNSIWMVIHRLKTETQTKKESFILIKCLEREREEAPILCKTLWYSSYFSFDTVQFGGIKHNLRFKLCLHSQIKESMLIGV